MPRPPRNALPPRGVYHVTNRGVARSAIFRDDVDRRLFLARLRRVVAAMKWKCFVYCLMTNHFHLLVATSLDDLSSGMQRLQGPYAQRFNMKYGRVGHLFQERFHTWAIRDERHFARTVEYIRNNPVVAGECETAADWPWSGGL
jgi:REP element-mobilizing transposase RayT